jgi:hypothetical protein
LIKDSETKRTGKTGLLKFCGPTEHGLDNLRNKVIYCQHFEAFNDPFEFWTRFVEGVPDPVTERERFIAAITEWGFGEDRFDEALENAPDYFDSLVDLQPGFRKMTEGMRIACFGSDADNLLMWSHYADGLRGFCLVFDEDLIRKAVPSAYITDVIYLEKPPFVDSFVYAVAHDQEDYNVMAMQETRAKVSYFGPTGEEQWIPGYEAAADEALRHMHAMWQHAFAAKPFEWRYENERRLLVDGDDKSRVPLMLSYPAEAITEIIVGERMPPAYLERLIATVADLPGDVPIRTARRSSEFYTLTIS